MKRLPFLVCVVAVPLLFAPSASARSTLYCGTLLNPDQWCSHDRILSVTKNEAYYPGAGTVRVGIRQVQQNGGIINRKFGYNNVSTNSAYRWTYAQVANASSSRHTVYGNVAYCEIPYETCPTPSAVPEDDDGSQPPTMLEPIGARRVGNATYTARRGTAGTRCVERRNTKEDVASSCSRRTSSAGVSTLVTEDRTADLDTGITRVYGIAPTGSTVVSVAIGERTARTARVVDQMFVIELTGSADEEVTVKTIR